jgi:formylglycine-generating enzyme required for sulfatase activity
MIELEAAPALDLSALVERLRLSGFRIDTRQYLTAHELLLALAAAGVQFDDDPDRLVSHLGPIFCTSVYEQDLFADEARNWFGRETRPDRPERTETSGHEAGTSTRFWNRQRLAFAAGAIAFVLLIGWRYYIRNVAPLTVPGSIVLESNGRSEPRRATVRWDGKPVSVDANGRFVIAATRNQLRTQLDRLSVEDPTLQSPSIETRLVAQTLRVVIRVSSQIRNDDTSTPIRSVAVPLPGTRTETFVTPWTTIALAALALASAAWGIAWLIARARRTLAIRRLPVQGDPDLVTLRVPETPVLTVAEEHLRRVAIALRRRRDEALVDLDVSSTIDASVRAAGFFTPRFSTRRATPEYLALVSRRCENDHQARIFDAVLDHLADLGVALDRYSFHDDPRFVQSETSARGYRLAEIVSRHHRATLLVCAESDAGFTHTARQVASWVEVTRPLVRRIYLTPEAPYRWTRFEFDLIEAGFIVLPATSSGWVALADLTVGGRLDSFATAPYARAFPSVLGTNELRWLDRNEPPPEIVQKLTRQLKGFLGPGGFSWLCACAVYPEVTWPLTLRVAHEPADYAVLPSLARLPWFRHGFMPDWLRRVLVDLLPADDEGRLRTTLERLLEELARHATDLPQAHKSKLSIARWFNPRDLLAGALPGSPLRDHVFIGFMFGARRDPLWLRAPQLLARVFRRGVGRFAAPRSDASAPVRSFRERLVARFRWWLVFRAAWLRLALSAVLGLVAFVALPPVMMQARVTIEQESISFFEIPGGEFAMGSDSKVDPRAASNEQPRHLLYVPTFLIAATEVTVAQYGVCVSEGACTPGERRALAGPANLPVRYLSWNEALEYCRWLEGGLKKWDKTPDLITGVLSGRIEGRPWHVTLPSEPEWEKAARGTDGRIYPWGNRFETIRATRQQATSAQAPIPAGSDQSTASPYGVLDMGGNVGEWTRSLSRLYPYTTADGRESLDDLQGSQGARVIRGGSLEASNNGEARSARRTTSPTNQRDPLVGFRVAISSLETVSPSAPDLTLARANPPAVVLPASPRAATPPTTKAATPPKASARKAGAPAAAIPTRPNLLDAERAGILSAMTRYQDAYRAKSLKDLRAVYPSLPREAGQSLDRQFRACRAFDVTFGNMQVALEVDDPTAATVRVRTTYTCQPPTSQARQSQTVEDVFVLRKVGGGWLIDRTGRMDSAVRR